MTYTLTDEQRARLQRKLDIDASESVFSDAELDDIFDEADGNFDRAKLIALEELMTKASKFNAYTIGQTSEQKQQVFDNMMKTVAYFKELVDGAEQVRIVGMRPVPHRVKDAPESGNAPRLRRRRYPYAG